MKILIINPNSDANITEAIQKTADDFAQGASGLVKYGVSISKIRRYNPEG